MRAYFNSDNYAPVLPEVMDALAAVNHGHEPAYGADPATARVEALIRAEFGERAHAFLVLNGTAANVVTLRAMLRPWQGVVCAESAHLNVDEGGAPERMGGFKLLTVAAPDGKLTPELVERRIVRIGDEHAVQPGVVSVTQSTELGTLYTPDELRALADLAHAHAMRLHVDGARLANAAAGLGISLREAAGDVDVLSFGATKNGGLGAESAVFLRPGPDADFLYRRKQGMQLPSKMRYAAAQFVALLTDDLWRRNAAHANAMAARLAAGVATVPGVEITHPVEANAVFAIPPRAVVAPLQERYPFYVWDEATGEVRWMTSFATTESDVDAFVAALAELAPTAAGRVG